MDIAGIVFDKDGTLFDFQATWADWTHRLLRQEAGDDPARLTMLADALGFDLHANAFRPDSIVIAATIDEVADHLLPLIAEDDFAALVDRLNALGPEVTQVPATPLAPLFATLRAQGLRLGLATNDAEAAARAHLEQAGVAGHFDLVLGYDSGHGGKPAPGQLLAFLQHTGLPAASCVMVGDSLHDLHAGRAAGMRTIGVLTGVASRQDLAPHADVVFASIAEIPAWLADQGQT